VTRTEGINTRSSRRGERKTEKEEREGGERERERGEGCRYREEKAEEEEKWVTRCKELIKSAVRYVRYRMVRYLRLQPASLLFLFLPGCQSTSHRWTCLMHVELVKPAYRRDTRHDVPDMSQAVEAIAHEPLWSLCCGLVFRPCILRIISLFQFI
jgi:hypothetical protein